MPTGARVRATTIRVRDHFVSARYGKTARQRYRSAASTALRQTILSSGDAWVEFDLFIEASELVCALFDHAAKLLAITATLQNRFRLV